MCLDSLGLDTSLMMHVSKPPKEGTPAHAFFANLRHLASVLYPKEQVRVEQVHKKINLATDFLAWEHEKFSISKLQAFTMSHHDTAFSMERNTILDTKVDQKVRY